ncbi:MAG: YerC/YecD family TrpR-related protein [Wenzhouxiangellaceae bacterium]|nr:YerC/YecD family TrpR-related protein [Wenzhouxiangellaceae bacterium]
MKPRSDIHFEDFDAGRRDLAAVLAALDRPEHCLALLEDLTTPAELEALVDRWRVAQLLDQGLPYREIHDRTGVSVTTIGRVARFIEMGHGGYRLALARLQQSLQGSSE